ncbi:helix-turn-helix domain-containing protein [Desulfobulbus alkaliphilus]|uniref:helix-turn-helix domain-containing protein n=1 Tax=Desulfobulbus alkaliphilus TaxID=869814 RepID=UPI001966A2C6|nr:helix-turn-helix domain-containing protein [Desulfobulbus alkaliphilus]MBM9536174.1 helix-turn-helix domain-containing protein [Desulfobulbus alkaliphilus]
MYRGQKTTTPLLSPVEAAEILGIKVDTLTVWRSTKRYPLPFVRVGRSIKYKAEDVAEFIERQTIAGQ